MAYVTVDAVPSKVHQALRAVPGGVKIEVQFGRQTPPSLLVFIGGNTIPTGIILQQCAVDIVSEVSVIEV